MNKKGISEIVSYTLLIVIAIGLSIIVFLFLRVYVFKGQAPECPPDVSIFINSATCFSASGQYQLNVDLINKGFFTIDAVYVRFREPNRKIQNLIGSPYDYHSFSEGLAPGEKTNPPLAFSLSSAQSGKEHTLEVQPVVKNDKGEDALCENAVVTKTVICS